MGLFSSLGQIGSIFSSSRALGKQRTRERRAAAGQAQAQQTLQSESQKFAPRTIGELVKGTMPGLGDARNALLEAFPQFAASQQGELSAIRGLQNRIFEGSPEQRFGQQNVRGALADRGINLSRQGGLVEGLELARQQVGFERGNLDLFSRERDVLQQLPGTNIQALLAGGMGQLQAQNQFQLGQLGQQFGQTQANIGQHLQSGVANIMGRAALRNEMFMRGGELIDQFFPMGGGPSTQQAVAAGALQQRSLAQNQSFLDAGLNAQRNAQRNAVTTIAGGNGGGFDPFSAQAVQFP